MSDLLPSGQLLLILGMALVTYIPRAVPLLFLSSRKLNPRFTRWLEMVPPAVLAALLAPELLLHRDPRGEMALFLSADNIFLLAVLPTWLAGRLTNNFFVAVVVGMAAVAGLRFFL